MKAIRPWLYVGKYRDTRDVALLSAYNIGAMLQLADLVKQPNIESLYLPVEDGIPIPHNLLRQGVDFVLDEKQCGQRVLIACGAGMSRSVAFVVAVLKETENLGLLEAFQAVKDRHPDTLLHPALWESLCEYYQEHIPVETLLRAHRESK